MGRDGLLGAFEEMVLLAVGRGGGDAYGMTVRREIEERTGREVTIGAVYSTLERLETKHLLESSYGDSDDARRGRARRHFRILPGGIEALERVRAMRAGLWDGVDLASMARDAKEST
jgi:PadR family transcriptional regulator PadR